jgi:prepilin peptidase CpaA
MIIAHAVAVAIAAIACVTDLRTRRIPNVLTFGAAAAGIVFHLASDGAPGAQTAAGGWLIGFALFFPMFMLGGLGAGDVKLLAALGAWLGPGTILFVAMYTAIAGGVLGIAVALGKGYLSNALHNIGYLMRFWTTVGIKPVEGLTLESGKGPRLAYAVPMLTGLLVTLWAR